MFIKIPTTLLGTWSMLNKREPGLESGYSRPGLLTATARTWSLAPKPCLMLTCATPHNLSLPETPVQLPGYTTED